MSFTFTQGICITITKLGLLQNLTSFMLTPLFDLEIRMFVCFIFPLYRRNRKMDTAAISQDSSSKQSRNRLDDRVHEQDYGCIVNTAFDQSESRNTQL